MACMPRRSPPSSSLNVGAGLLIGVVIGLFIDNVGLGIGVGLAIGIALSLLRPPGDGGG